MQNKPNRQKRMKVKDLPKHEKRLNTGEMKKVKGGAFNTVGTAKVKVPGELLGCAHGCPACPHPGARLS